MQLTAEAMPKFQTAKRNDAAQSSPYNHAPAKTKAANNVFKMNTDMGQHVLKNPGVAQAIVDKADLKQSDVCLSLYSWLQQLYVTNVCSDCA